MSRHMAFRRQPVDGQNAQNLKTITLAAPTRGIVMDENEAYMKPGGCIVSDNWLPTLRGLKLRGGCVRWCDVHALDAPAWVVSHVYTVGTRAYDGATGTFWDVAVAHTSAATPTTFAQDRAAHPTFWTDATASVTRLPLISGFEYVSGNIAKMFAANATKLFEVTNATPVLVKSGQTSGNYSASQLANAAGDFLLAVNDNGDFPLRFKGATWVVLDPALGAPADGASAITYNVLPAGVTQGKGLTYVWKYRNRWFFIQGGTMDAWYLPLDAVGGVLQKVPLSGAASKGGSLLFGATWSIDAGDGIDDKCVFVTNQGEVIVFTGGDPSVATGSTPWHQEGVYAISPPMGMNAWTSVGGDLLIATVDGIVPISAAITKTGAQLELAMITRAIKPMWRDEVAAKRALPWQIKKWDEYGGLFVTWPGGLVGNRYCAAANNATGAWARCFGWDAMHFLVLRGQMYFGTQIGVVMQADRTGYDDGVPYVATLVGGWETFGQPSAQFTWHQARAVFTAPAGQLFIPQLSATVNYIVTLPTPPSPGPDPGLPEVWDQGLWDVARWDQPSIARGPIRNTMWVSIGKSGFSHAPIVQVTVAQQATPNVELVAISATFEPAGVNV